MTKRIIECEGVIWDMDGTLSDLEPEHLRAYQQTIAAYGVTLSPEEYERFLGATDGAIAQYLIAQHQLPLSADLLVAKKEELVVPLIRERAILRPGVLQALQTIKRLGAKCAVGSSSMLATIKLVVGTLNIADYFDALASGEEVENSKPAPDVFLLAAKRLGIVPSRCLIMEDSLNGVIAAKAACMFCIAVPCPSTKEQDHSQADARLNSYEDLIATDTGFIAGDLEIRFGRG